MRKLVGVSEIPDYFKVGNLSAAQFLKEIEYFNVLRLKYPHLLGILRGLALRRQIDIGLAVSPRDLLRGLLRVSIVNPNKNFGRTELHKFFPKTDKRVLRNVLKELERIANGVIPPSPLEEDSHRDTHVEVTTNSSEAIQIKSQTQFLLVILIYLTFLLCRLNL